MEIEEREVNEQPRVRFHQSPRSSSAAVEGICQLIDALVPEGQADMSRGRFVITQCTTLCALLIILLCLLTFVFVQNKEMRDLMIHFLTTNYSLPPDGSF